MAGPPHKRRMMRLHLTAQPSSTVADVRAITTDDALLLGPLMYDAYHGTIDDDGDTPEQAEDEASATLNGKYGPFLATCSFIMVRDGRAHAASVLTDWTDDQTGKHQPLLAFLLTHPDAQGQGHATALLQRSINALLAAGYHELVLFVTVGNSAAQHIYHKLGFVVEEEF